MFFCPELQKLIPLSIADNIQHRQPIGVLCLMALALVESRWSNYQHSSFVSYQLVDLSEKLEKLRTSVKKLTQDSDWLQGALGRLERHSNIHQSTVNRLEVERHSEG